MSPRNGRYPPYSKPSPSTCLRVIRYAPLTPWPSVHGPTLYPSVWMPVLLLMQYIWPTTSHILHIIQGDAIYISLGMHISPNYKYPHLRTQYRGNMKKCMSESTYFSVPYISLKSPPSHNARPPPSNPTRIVLSCTPLSSRSCHDVHACQLYTQSLSHFRAPHRSYHLCCFSRISTSPLHATRKLSQQIHTCVVNHIHKPCHVLHMPILEKNNGAFSILHI
jgi:hypothetical protein